MLVHNKSDMKSDSGVVKIVKQFQIQPKMKKVKEFERKINKHLFVNSNRKSSNLDRITKKSSK